MQGVGAAYDGQQLHVGVDTRRGVICSHILLS